MENSNANSSWKESLNNPDNFDADYFAGKDLAWAKLQQRLPAASKNKIAWYWYAAAAVIGAIIFFMFQHNDTAHAPQHGRGLVQSSTKKDHAPAKKDIASSNKNISPAASAATMSGKKATKTSVKEKGAEEKTKSSPEPVVAENANNDNIFFSGSPSQDSSASSQQTIALLVTKEDNIAAALPAKKMKVIHINEVGGIPDEQPTLARYYDKHFMQIRLLNQQVYSDIPIEGSSHNTGFSILKSKNNSSN